MKIDLKELGLAYRRAKADMFYTRNPNSFKILRYEKNLVKNLKRLQSLLCKEEFGEIYSSCCYGWRLVPKKVVFEEEQKKTVCPDVVLNDLSRRVKFSELRLVEDVPLDFHVITQLWVDRIGNRYERCMEKSSFGYRMRMHCDKVNKLYPGTFKYWQEQYRKWHDGGLDAIQRALEEKRNVVVLTADFSSFYHNLSPRFILGEEFLREIGMRPLKGDDLTLTKLVVEMLEHWGSASPLAVGLPVGCSVSAIIANLSLTLFDKSVNKLPHLISYGRYVDDVIITIEDTGEIKTINDFVSYLDSNGVNVKSDGGRYCYSHPAIKISKKLFFVEDKTRLFLLGAAEGIGFINSLKDQIKKRSSEWRLLPDLPDNPLDLVKSIVAITDRHGLEVDKLRQSEEVSIRRAAFAMKLSDFADYALCLDPADWQDQREAFLEAIKNYFTSTETYFDLYGYFPRLIALASHGTVDFPSKSRELMQDIYGHIVKAVEKSFNGEVRIASQDVKDLDVGGSPCAILLNTICQGFREAIAASVKDQCAREVFYSDLAAAFPGCAGMLEERQQPSFDELLLADLAHVPYKTIILSAHDIHPESYALNAHRILHVDQVLPHNLVANCRELLGQFKIGARLVKANAWSGMLFPIRMFKPVELYAILPAPYAAGGKSRKIIVDFLEYYNYANVGKNLISFKRLKKGPSYLYAVGTGSEKHVNEGGEERYRHGVYKIALAYWSSSQHDWECQLKRGPNPNRAERYKRLMRLVNRIIRSGEKIDYLVFPELSMPWRWYMFIAAKMIRCGISLIAGVEYLSSPRKNSVRNEVWCSLKSDILKFPSALLVRMPKFAPAHEERSGLGQFGFWMDALRSGDEVCAGDVIVHGSEENKLFFSVLICSDLTDVDLRARLRGAIDLLVVPAWNPDVHTFNALITASAHDLHSYVALCNNGMYGDTRIRAPYQEMYNRDIVQLKGGCNDYFVIGEIKVDALRRFQKDQCRVGDPKYKPKPIGFKMSELREQAVHSYRQNFYQYKHIVAGIDGIRINRKLIRFESLYTEARLLEQVREIIKDSSISKEVVAELLDFWFKYLAGNDN